MLQKNLLYLQNLWVHWINFTSSTFDKFFAKKYGIRYVGEWKNGTWNGQGTFTSNEGTKYHGEFLNGEFYGQGMGTTPNGNFLVGEWKNNSPWDIMVLSKDGNTLGKVVNGEIQK